MGAVGRVRSRRHARRLLGHRCLSPPASSVDLPPVGLDGGGTLSLPSPAPHRTVEGTPGPFACTGLQREERVCDRACIDSDKRHRPPPGPSSQAWSSRGANARPPRPFPARSCPSLRESLPQVQPQRRPISVLHCDASEGCSNRNFLPAWCCVSAIHMATSNNSKPSSCVLTRFRGSLIAFPEPKCGQERSTRRSKGCHPWFLSLQDVFQPVPSSHGRRIPIPSQPI